MTDLLDNITWHALAGPHAKFAAGVGDVRRYTFGFSPIVGFADTDHPSFGLLARFCQPGEHFYCENWNGPTPDGWKVELESTMFKMLWGGGVPEDDLPGAVLLTKAHAPLALDLATRTRPGPFGPRTLELGDYFGVFEKQRLVAMAGERMHAGSLREISGVCTDPDFRGRGFARKLMNKLIHRQLERGETPFLHVMRDNTGARELYEDMGFVHHREVVVRVISPS